MLNKIGKLINPSGLLARLRPQPPRAATQAPSHLPIPQGRKPAPGGVAPRNGQLPMGLRHRADTGPMPAQPWVKAEPQAWQEALAPTKFKGVPVHPQREPQQVGLQTVLQEPTPQNPGAILQRRPYGPPTRPPPKLPVAPESTPHEAAQATPALPEALPQTRPYGPPTRPPPKLPVAPESTPHEASQAAPTLPKALPQTRPHVPPKHTPSKPVLKETALAKPATSAALMPQRPERPPVEPQAMPMYSSPIAANYRQVGPHSAPESTRPPLRLPPKYAALYTAMNLKEAADTQPTFTNVHLTAPPKMLGSGAFNTVFAVKLKTPSGTLDGVFKPLGLEENGWVAEATGIPQHDAQIAMRNIATLSYARKLGFDVIPDTRIAVIDPQPGPVSDPKLGMVMERARGKPASQAKLSLLKRPDVCAEVTKLQLLDHLTGQGDRHHNNFFIDIGSDGRPKVTGIDNDQCFGSKLTDPNGIRYVNKPTHDGFRGTWMPPVVDTEMAAKIKSLTSDDIRGMLGDKLSEDEVKAALDRHAGVKSHIRALESLNRVIDPSEWGTPDVQNRLRARNSYIGREREDIRAERRYAHAQAQADAQVDALLKRIDAEVEAKLKQAPRQPNAGW